MVLNVMALKRMPGELLTRGDIVVLFMALFFVTYLYSVYWQGTRSSGEYIHVVTGGDAPKKISLLQNQVFTVSGKIGASKIQIEGGRVRFISSPCVNKLCLHQGWLNLSGEIIACVPNQISASIIGRQSKFDAINF